MLSESKVYDSIPFFKLVTFNLKNIIKELSFVVLNIFLIVFSIIFGILCGILKNGQSIVIFFNFFVLIYVSCFIFIFALRMIQFYFHNKFEDKTTFIAISNQVSRSKFFLSQWFLIVMTLIINIVMSFILINLIYLIFNGFTPSELVLRITSTFLIYALLCSFLLVNFIVFLIFTFSLQSTTIICTMLLSFSFIANLPATFNTQNEETLRLSVKYNDENSLYYLSDVYETFDLQNYVNKSQIKYKYLSKYINDFLTAEQNSFTIDNFNNNDYVINKRINDLWGVNGLGITKNETEIFIANNVYLNTIPGEYSELFNFSSPTTISFGLKNWFISLDTLKQKIINTTDQNIKNILNDLYNFTNEIIDKIGSSTTTNSALWNREFQQQKNELLNDFIFVDEQKTFMTQGSNIAYLSKQDVNSIYRFELIGEPKSNDFLTLQSGYADSLVTEMYSPLLLAARILEQYFIDYTSRYTILTNYQLDQVNSDWNEYIKNRNLLNASLTVNLFAQLLTSYTIYSGFSYEDFWFEPFSSSKIELKNQENLFLGYPQYTLKLVNGKITKDTYNNFINPLYSIIFLVIFAIFCLGYSIIKFNLIDFK